MKFLSWKEQTVTRPWWVILATLLAGVIIFACFFFIGTFFLSPEYANLPLWPVTLSVGTIVMYVWAAMNLWQGHRCRTDVLMLFLAVDMLMDFAFLSPSVVMSFIIFLSLVESRNHPFFQK